MKKLFICFDGTSNTYDASYTTNVVKLHKSAASFDRDGQLQEVFYIEGVGAKLGTRIRGGAFGKGLFKRVLRGYARFADVMQDDPEAKLFLCGFSRGAYTARSMAGLIGFVGVLEPGTEAQIEQAEFWYKKRTKIKKEKDSKQKTEFFKWRAKNSPNWCANPSDQDWRSKIGLDPKPIYKIEYIGVWDTVKTVGLAVGKYKWHDHDLSKHVKSARHAIAIDERRKKFNYVAWDNIAALNASAGKVEADSESAVYQQKWYPGNHGSVGGGGPVAGLSDDALTWLLRGAEAAGFNFHSTHGLSIFDIRPNALAPLRNDEGSTPNIFKKGLNKIIGLFGEIDRKGPPRAIDLSRSALLRYFAKPDLLPEKIAYRPNTIKALLPELDGGDPLFNDDDYRILIENMRQQDLASDEEKYVTMLGGRYRIHVVKKGDTLSKLAERYLGDMTRYPELFNINSAVLDDPDKIYIGMRLFIPVPLAH